MLLVLSQGSYVLENNANSQRVQSEGKPHLSGPVRGDQKRGRTCDTSLMYTKMTRMKPWLCLFSWCWVGKSLSAVMQSLKYARNLQELTGKWASTFIFSFVILLVMEKFSHRSSIMNSAAVVKPAIRINSITLDHGVEADELWERRLMGAWPVGRLTKANEELQ